jgi:hypothetical protein
MKQFSKKIGNEECIRKDQCPIGYSLKTNLYFSPFICFPDTQNFFTVHPSLRQQFCKKRTNWFVIFTSVYPFSNFLLRIFKNAKPPKIINQMINKL